MVADEILKSRPFSLNHGGILDTRDIVGIKKGGDVLFCVDMIFYGRRNRRT